MSAEEDPARALVHKLASESLRAGDPTGWFDKLYTAADGDSRLIPWVDMKPNAALVSWLDQHSAPDRAIVVGCGLGEDAEELATRGYDVAAFDVSPAAIEWARRRSPDSKVRYFAASLFELPHHVRRAFNLAVEIHTVQALPLSVRERALQCVAELVAPGGKLLISGRFRDDAEDPGDLPWPISRAELTALTKAGLQEATFEAFLDTKDPPVRRFRAVYVR